MQQPTNHWFARTFAAGATHKETECEHGTVRLEKAYHENRLVCVRCGQVTQKRTSRG